MVFNVIILKWSLLSFFVSEKSAQIWIAAINLVPKTLNKKTESALTKSKKDNEKTKAEKHWDETYVIYGSFYICLRSPSGKWRTGGVRSLQWEKKALEWDSAIFLSPSLSSSRSLPSWLFQLCLSLPLCSMCSAGVPPPISLTSLLLILCLRQLLSTVFHRTVCQHCLKWGINGRICRSSFTFLSV